MIARTSQAACAIGSLLAASMAPCCFPALAVIGSALGLTAIAPAEPLVLYGAQALVGLSLAAAVFAFRMNRSALLLVGALLSATPVLLAMNFIVPLWWAYPGFAGLVLCAVAQRRRPA